MALEKFLTKNETRNLIHKDDFNGVATDSFALRNGGARLVLTLNVSALGAGLSVQVTVKNGFSLDVPLETISVFTRDSLGYSKKILSDFHSIFEIEVAVIGGEGNASFALGVTVLDDAMASMVLGRGVDVDWDSFYKTKPDSVTDVWTFVKDLVIVRTVTLGYSDASKTELISGSKV